MAHTFSTISVSRKKSVIELVNEESDSKSDSSDSAFKTRPFKKAKKAKAKKVQKKKEADGTSQKQMKQREGNKATREQKLLIACMGRDSTERA
eukprot:1682685-Ditylum_brightwellii.AAC.1